MITYGYVKEVNTREDGTLWIKTRIPSIHGANSQKEYGGKPIRNYTADDDLPWFQSVILPTVPSVGSIVALSSLNDSNSELIIIGLMRVGE